MIGVTGLYYEKFDPESVWINWFVISENHRRKGYGSMLYDFTLKEAKKTDRKYFKVFTDTYRDAAIKFYRKKKFRKFAERDGLVYFKQKL